MRGFLQVIYNFYANNIYKPQCVPILQQVYCFLRSHVYRANPRTLARVG
jgi:hypothetical protein